MIARQELRDRIEELKKDAKRFFAKLETGDADHENAYARAIAELARMRSAPAPFSAFCAALIEPSLHEEYLFALRHGYVARLQGGPRSRQPQTEGRQAVWARQTMTGFALRGRSTVDR